MAYIDRDLLLQDIGESVVFTVRDSATSPELRGARKIVDRIKNAPTADVVEVKRGEWGRTQFVGKSGFYNLRDVICSKCKTISTFVYGEKTPMNYCPNCGAIMNGGKEE